MLNFLYNDGIIYFNESIFLIIRISAFAKRCSVFL